MDVVDVGTGDEHGQWLAAARLVDVRRAGNRRFYRLRPEGLAEAVTFLETMWSASLSRLQHEAEQEEHAHTGDQDAKGLL